MAAVRQILVAAWALVAVSLACLAPAHAAWWVETQVSRDDVRVTVERDGKALVEHRIVLRISGGPLYELEVRGVDPDAQVEADGYIVPERDADRNSLSSAVPIHPELRVATLDDGREQSRLVIGLNGKEGIRRGIYVVLVRYRTDFAARGLIESRGALDMVRWTGPEWEDGLDSTRATFVLPLAPTKPRAADAAMDIEPDGTIPPTFLSSLKRTSEHDELELMRPYAAKGEPVEWALAVDGRALDVVAASATSEATLADEPDSRPASSRPTLLEEMRQPVLLGVAGALFLLFSVLTAIKGVVVRRHANAAGAKARPLVPLPLVLRAPLAGLAVVAGVALQLPLGSGTLGSLSIAIAALLCAHRSPLWHRRPLRGPGKWLPVSAREAFGTPATPTGAWLDADTWSGRAVFMSLAAGVAAAVYQASLSSEHHATLLALDSVVLIALFFTGRAAELPPDPAVAPGRFLAAISKRLSRTLGSEVRIIPRIRLPQGQPDADEVRLMLLPRRPVSGLKGIEIAVVHVPAPGGTITNPEILLRFKPGSAAERALGHLVEKGGRQTRGRSADERVISFSPRLPTERMTAEIAAALIARATDCTKQTAKIELPKREPIAAPIDKAA